MKKFEYKTAIMRKDDVLSVGVLNRYGHAGWELVGMVTCQANIMYVFKREKIAQ